ncbi:hypothetical protein HPB52_013488 [Rhipicephalus sanguineus]|uniref:dolichyl-phosphate-mannose--protein mannosyltransferase n=1 Tax=Rhipicephalus sanguineus TaxID=34632 RepID=A0A9D4Q2F6_RHISA|nr:hypothetical protein HPB52_013488 [Rhipicephalus sanguineus]
MATVFDHNRNSTGLKFPKKEWTREVDRSWDQALPVPKWAIHLGPWLVAGASLACFGHSLAGDFVFDDTEAVVHNVDIQPVIPLRRIFEDDFWGTELQSESKPQILPAPYHTYIQVAAVVGRADLLCAVFFILSFLSFIRSCSSGTLAMVACGALAIRWKVMGSSSPVFQRIDNPASFEENFFVRWLCFDWSMGCLTLIRSISDIRIASVVALWLSLAVLVSQMVLAPDAQLRRSLCIALSLLVVPFLPASNIFFRVGFVVAERVLYLPSMGFCLLVVLGMARFAAALPQHRQVLRYCLIVLLLVFTVRSIQRCHEWTKESSLFESGLKVCPGNAKVHYNFAKNVGDSGDREGAIQGYREALRLHPDYDQAMNNLANILRDVGQLQEAQALLHRAVQLRPDFAAAWMNLGIVQSSLGLLDDAEQSYRTAISHRTKYPDCYYNLGNLYLEQKRYEDAYRAWRNATRQRPTHLVSWNNLVLMLDQRGHASDAERAALQALRHLPHEPALHFQLANILGKAGKYQRSEQHFLAAIRFSPDNPSYHTNLGVLYHRWKKYDQAEERYRRALKLKPDLKSARDNLNMLLQQTRLQAVEAKR